MQYISCDCKEILSNLGGGSYVSPSSISSSSPTASFGLLFDLHFRQRTMIETIMNPPNVPVDQLMNYYF